MANFFGIDAPNFRGGARPAVEDVNGGPRVVAFEGRLVGIDPLKLSADFFLFEPVLRNGAFVAVGDVDVDGRADLIGGGGPRVLALSGADLLAGTGGGARGSPTSSRAV
ncbi:hypothetical protein J0H58_26930 [bacterium]|nr:hypothetical protein [bacterium]